MTLKRLFFVNQRVFHVLFVIVLATGILIASACNYYHLPPLAIAKNGVKFSATQILRHVYAGDLYYNHQKKSTYWVGSPQIVADRRGITADLPFIYEELDAPHLQELRREFKLLDYLEPNSKEYEIQLKLAAWLGTRWDHGTTPVHGGKEQLNPLKLIKEGENGAKYWCEIAAIVTVQTATALGWPARLVSLSRDGYTFEHGVAELWSNQFNKWFVVDTDFNVIFERQGIPLSAFEICHYGPEWKKQGQLGAIFFAPPKPSLSYQDLLPFYRYVFVDLRNDWLSRNLSRGSPAGGDLATFWTARENSGPLLTSSQRVDKQELFDWQVNRTWVRSFGNDDKIKNGTLEVGGYSPYFDHFELQLNEGPWVPWPSGKFTYNLPDDVKSFAARMVTSFGHRGPAVYGQGVGGLEDRN